MPGSVPNPMMSHEYLFCLPFLSLMRMVFRLRLPLFLMYSGRGQQLPLMKFTRHTGPVILSAAKNLGVPMRFFAALRMTGRSWSLLFIRDAPGGRPAEKGSKAMVKTMTYELIEVSYSGDFATITMNYPQRRNALSLKHMLELTAAFREVGESKARGVILAANGPAFSAGHDFGDMVGRDLMAIRELLQTCTTLMETIQSIPQPVLARVHAIATAAGCQLVATCDLAVASTD